MTDNGIHQGVSVKRTRLAYLLNNLLGSPFWVLFTISPFILYRDLHATPLQITVITTLKPIVSLFSFYWGSTINQRRDRLLPNVIWAKVIGLIPFFFFPFIQNVWLLIASMALFMTFYRGAGPAWMEILRLNLQPVSRNRVFAAGSFIAHVSDALFPFLIGWILDNYHEAWRWLFPVTALISLSSIFFKSRIPIPPQVNPAVAKRENLSQSLVNPLKNASDLLNNRPDFLKFLLGFMLGGAGMMIAQPLLPQFFDAILHLSYTEMSVAIIFCKGIGFSLTTPIWTRYLDKVNFFTLSALPPLGICLFSVCLIYAQYHIVWLFMAYLCYGVVQAGSHLCWHLSGPIFAKDNDSAPFSNVNVLAVGVRGCFIPPIGAVLGYYFGPAAVIAMGGLLCFMAFLSLSRSAQYRRPEAGALKCEGSSERATNHL